MGVFYSYFFLGIFKYKESRCIISDIFVHVVMCVNMLGLMKLIYVTRMQCPVSLRLPRTLSCNTQYLYYFITQITLSGSYPSNNDKLR